MDDFLIGSLTRACRIRNDRIVSKLPIYKDVLEIILGEIQKLMTKLNQPYFETLYLALFSTIYYGMLRIGEATSSPYCLLADNVQVAVNKEKFLLVVYTSKTHNRSDRLQMIKISSIKPTKRTLKQRRWCPFKLLNNYIESHPLSTHNSEQFFVFTDGSPVTASHVRKILKLAILNSGLNPTNYCVHGMHAGHASDLLRMGFSVETIKKLGRWRSNAVFSYLRDL